MAGPVDLTQAPRWRDALIQALAEGYDIRIDLSDTGPWDLAGLQLMISSLASARRVGRHVQVVELPRVFRDVCERAGLLELFDSAD
jgi:anti-anti-sigma regulatory factor